MPAVFYGGHFSCCGARGDTAEELILCERAAGRGKAAAAELVQEPGMCGSPEGYLQGQVRHPFVCACGASTSPYRGGI